MKENAKECQGNVRKRMQIARGMPGERTVVGAK